MGTGGGFLNEVRREGDEKGSIPESSWKRAGPVYVVPRNSMKYFKSGRAATRQRLKSVILSRRIFGLAGCICAKQMSRGGGEINHPEEATRGNIAGSKEERGLVIFLRVPGTGQGELDSLLLGETTGVCSPMEGRYVTKTPYQGGAMPGIGRKTGTSFRIV